MPPRQFLKALQPTPLAQRIHAWEVEHSGQLTERQKEVLDDLVDHLQLLMEQYHGGPEPLDCDRERFDLDTEAYDRLIRSAHRGGLSDHPLVRERMMTRRQQQLVDTWNEKGLPFGKEPYVVPEIIKALRKVHQGKVSLREAYRCLKKEGKIPSITYQAFHHSCCDNHFLRPVGIEQDGGTWVINVYAIYHLPDRGASGVTPQYVEDQILYALHRQGPQDRTAISGLLSRHVQSRWIDLALYSLQQDHPITIEQQKSPKGGRPRTVIRLASSKCEKTSPA
jgi:hypothetical protein